MMKINRPIKLGGRPRHLGRCVLPQSRTGALTRSLRNYMHSCRDNFLLEISQSGVQRISLRDLDRETSFLHLNVREPRKVSCNFEGRDFSAGGSYVEMRGRKATSFC